MGTDRQRGARRAWRVQIRAVWLLVIFGAGAILGAYVTEERARNAPAICADCGVAVGARTCRDCMAEHQDRQRAYFDSDVIPDDVVRPEREQAETE